MIDISSWLLKIISKKRSIQGESLLWQCYCDWNIFLNDEYVFQNAHKGEDQNTNLSCGWLNDNVRICEYDVEMK